MFLHLRPYLPTAILSILLAYCCVQFMTGDKGLFSQDNRQKDLMVAENKLEKLKSERQDLEARARYLRTDNLSKDLLEERARVILGFGEANEYVIRDQIDKSANS
ncbi:FtsB family cell division protein [Asticcacaulis endophyticus]|nr:septum formation initiator family protein [Asticcacaulis endophyticus]